MNDAITTQEIDLGVIKALSVASTGSLRVEDIILDGCAITKTAEFQQLPQQHFEPCKPIKQQRRRYKPSFTL